MSAEVGPPLTKQGVDMDDAMSFAMEHGVTVERAAEVLAQRKVLLDGYNAAEDGIQKEALKLAEHLDVHGVSDDPRAKAILARYRAAKRQKAYYLGAGGTHYALWPKKISDATAPEMVKAADAPAAF